MNKTKWKEIILYMIAVLVSKGRLAGCYPLIPGFFAVAFMEGGNRTLLLIFTIFGMALFIPVQAMAKYTMALLLTGLFLPLTGPRERAPAHSCRGDHTGTRAGGPVDGDPGIRLCVCDGNGGSACFAALPAGRSA